MILSEDVESFYWKRSFKLHWCILEAPTCMKTMMQCKTRFPEWQRILRKVDFQRFNHQWSLLSLELVVLPKELWKYFKCFLMFSLSQIILKNMSKVWKTTKTGERKLSSVNFLQRILFNSRMTVILHLINRIIIKILTYIRVNSTSNFLT